MMKHGVMILGVLCIALLIVAMPVNLRADYACGDTDGDGTVSVSDAVFLFGYLYVGAMSPLADADVDQCGSVNISDIMYIFDYILNGGPAPCEGSVDCNLPTGNNAITLGCPVQIYNTVDSFSVPLYITSDEPINAFSLGFIFNSDDITVTSLDTTGSILPQGFFLNLYPNYSVNNSFEIIMYTTPPAATSLPPQTEGLICNIWFTLNPGSPAQEIDIDTFTNFPGPEKEIIFSVEGGGSINPNYSDCGTSDVVISAKDYICGDANHDGQLNISDAVYIINYVFVSGAPAPDPLAAADTNCDGKVNVSDAIWMINRIFAGGFPPCDPNNDGIPDC